MVTVCLVNGVFPPHEYGGAENYVLRVAKRLRTRDIEAVVLTTKPYDGVESLRPERTTHDGVPVVRFYPLNLSHRSNGTGGTPPAKAVWHQLDTFNPHAKRAAARALADIDPDIVHTNNLMGISAAVARAIHDHNSRFVHTLHDYSLLCPKSNLLREWTAPDGEVAVCETPPAPCRMYAHAKRRQVGTPDLVTAPSQHVIDVHRKHGFFTDADATRIRLGVESVADDPPSLPEEPAVIYVGKHLRAKGLETLFEAARRRPNIRFHLCGTGPYDDHTANADDALDNVTYHGYVSDDELYRLRRNSTAAVVPSRWMENSPLVIYESFALGLPVVGSDIGGIPELVESGVRGKLFTPGDAAALADRLDALVSAPETLREMQENALTWAGDHTLDTHIDRLIDAYDYETVELER